MKTCKMCRVEKQLSAFYKNSGSEDGLRARCKECDNKEHARRRQPGWEDHKLCCGCNQLIHRSKFSEHKSTRLGMRSRCKECNAKEAEAWRKENPEKYEEAKEAHKINRRERYKTDEEYREKIKKTNNEKWHALSPEEKYRRGRANALKTNYNLTVEEYDRIFVEQGSCCACCGDQSENYEVDHDHTTGKIRGIICKSCNTGIGLLGDYKESLILALAYLSKSEL